MYNTKKSIFQIIKISVPIQASLYCYMQYKAKKRKKNKNQKLIQMSVGFSLHLHFRMKTDTKKPDIITLLFACWLFFFFLVLFLPPSLTYFLNAGIYIYRPATGFRL